MRSSPRSSSGRSRASPTIPGAWLMATAKHRAIDQLRRHKRLERKHEELGHEIEAQKRAAAPDLDAALDDDVGDDLLRLVFTACHPVLSTEARVALTLRLLGGLTTEEIARAFLVPEPTIAQRIVRAKRTLAEARVPFEVPRGAELAARLSSVLEVIYLVFNEGYSATAGDDWMRPGALRRRAAPRPHPGRARPGEAEVHGLVALMEIQASRSRARGRARRASPSCSSIRTAARWDHLLIRRGLAALAARRDARRRARARTLCRPRSPPVTRERARRRRPTGRASPRSTRRWPSVTPSPVVELNRAVAVAMAFGAEAGPRDRRRADLGAVARELPPLAERARRSPRQARPLRRGPRGVRARRLAHAQRARARAAARTRRRLCAQIGAARKAVVQ